jgi:hypothetical protein
MVVAVVAAPIVLLAGRYAERRGWVSGNFDLDRARGGATGSAGPLSPSSRRPSARPPRPPPTIAPPETPVTLSLNVVVLLYLVASIFFIQALKGLSHPTTSRRGNLFGMVGMAIAVATTVALIAKMSGGVGADAAATAAGVRGPTGPRSPRASPGCWWAWPPAARSAR